MKPTSNVAKNMPEPWDLIIFISTFDIDIEGVCAGLALYNHFFYLNPTWTSLLFCIPAFLFHLGEYAGHGGLWDHHLQDVRSVSAFYRENFQMI
jgi:phage shock protein PspC (stress-responsive transcriptional regulator)